MAADDSSYDDSAAFLSSELVSGDVCGSVTPVPGDNKTAEVTRLCPPVTGEPIRKLQPLPRECVEEESNVGPAGDPLNLRRPATGMPRLARLQAKAHLQRSAAGNDYSYREPMTTVANPSVLKRPLDQPVPKTGPTVAIFSADIIQPPTVGDTPGRLLNDELSEAVCGRLRRLIEPDGTIVAMASNRTLVVCKDLGDVLMAEALAARIEVVLNGTYSLRPTNVSVTSSVTVLFVGAAEDLPQEVRQHADSHRPGHRTRIRTIMPSHSLP